MVWFRSVEVSASLAVAGAVMLASAASAGDQMPNQQHQANTGQGVPALSLETRTTAPPSVNEMQARPNASKVIEGSPIGPGYGNYIVPPEEYEYPNCCGWACSCEPSSE